MLRCLQPHKIILGTAQFGLDYGVANKTGKPTIQQCQDLLDLCKTVNINALDTSISYGNSQEVLRKLKINGFRVQSKIIVGSDVSITSQVEMILRQLGVNEVDTILIHDPWNISRKCEKDLLSLEELKRKQRVKNIGVSVYTEDDLRISSDAINLDVVQVPMNIFDQRFCSNPVLQRLSEQGTEVQARSIFLQGLLLMDSNDLPQYFKPWIGFFERFERHCKLKKISKINACTQFIVMNSLIDNYVYGFDNAQQLKTLLQSYVEVNHDFSKFECHDERLLLPMNWKL